jgi:hypothetical protein
VDQNHSYFWQSSRSYAAAEIMAKKIKSHTVAESVILLSYYKIVNIMYGEEYEKKF